MVRKFEKCVSALAVVLMVSMAIPWSAFAATIQTDLWIYQNGDTIKVTGDGFQAGEDVQLVTTDPNGTEVDRGTTIGDTAGNIAYSFVLNATMGGIYDVNATGLDSVRPVWPQQAL